MGNKRFFLSSFEKKRSDNLFFLQALPLSSWGFPLEESFFFFFYDLFIFLEYGDIKGNEGRSTKLHATKILRFTMYF